MDLNHLRQGAPDGLPGENPLKTSVRTVPAQL